MGCRECARFEADIVGAAVSGKFAIVSAAFGEKHVTIAGLSYPSFKRYAQFIGADFVPITERMFPDRNPHIEKFQIRDILKKYDAVLWVDCDTLVSKHACSIFEHVPEGHFAAVDEGLYGTEMDVDLEIRTLTTGLGLPFPTDRKFVYFNSGVFVVWKEHKSLFENIPDVIPTSYGINDQTLLNARVALSRIPFKALSKTWNMLWVPVGFELAHIIHFAGRWKDNTMLADMQALSISV